jgi:hypothetical protein
MNNYKINISKILFTYANSESLVTKFNLVMFAAQALLEIRSGASVHTTKPSLVASEYC